MVLQKKRPNARKVYEKKLQWRARVDLLTGMRKIRGGRFQRDGVHLSAKGREWVVEAIWKLLESTM